MAVNTYDVIVVGARCAGSPTAMLLARKGYKTLVVDRATFPSDTISTHLVHPPGVVALQRWGLLDRLTATGCPPIDTYAFDFGPFTISGAPGTDEAPVAYSPRRTVLDKLLVDAASEAGAEVREGFTVEDVVIEDGRVTGIRGHGKGGATVSEGARVVIGADGRHSLVARAVEPEQYNEKPPLLCGYYTYWSGLPMNGRFETYIRPDRGFAAWPTHDGLTLVIGGWPFAESNANKKDIEGNYLDMLELAPAFADRVRAATREARFAGTAVSNFFRKPYGPGWALVGDAGYNKDFITAQGIHDAFRDAELCVD
ncbi:MAG: NAD(P)/FAD-dependent oxidoreductase, partial [Acidimicrobiia bacterium]